MKQFKNAYAVSGVKGLKRIVVRWRNPGMFKCW